MSVRELIELLQQHEGTFEVCARDRAHPADMDSRIIDGIKLVNAAEGTFIVIETE